MLTETVSSGTITTSGSLYHFRLRNRNALVQTTQANDVIIPKTMITNVYPLPVENHRLAPNTSGLVVMLMQFKRISSYGAKAFTTEDDEVDGRLPLSPALTAMQN
jgi:hypothetical protein